MGQEHHPTLDATGESRSGVSVRRVLRYALRVVGIILVCAIVWFIVMMLPVTANATISPEILAQGELYTGSEGGVICFDNINIGIADAGRGEFGPPRAEVGIWITDDPSLGGIYALRLGESVVIPDVGTVILVSFGVSYSTQQVTFLFIPEP